MCISVSLHTNYVTSACIVRLPLINLRVIQGSLLPFFHRTLEVHSVHLIHILMMSFVTAVFRLKTLLMMCHSCSCLITHSRLAQDTARQGCITSRHDQSTMALGQHCRMARNQPIATDLPPLLFAFFIPSVHTVDRLLAVQHFPTLKIQTHSPRLDGSKQNEDPCGNHASD